MTGLNKRVRSVALVEQNINLPSCLSAKLLAAFVLSISGCAAEPLDVEADFDEEKCGFWCVATVADATRRRQEAQRQAAEAARRNYAQSQSNEEPPSDECTIAVEKIQTMAGVSRNGLAEIRQGCPLPDEFYGSPTELFQWCASQVSGSYALTYVLETRWEFHACIGRVVDIPCNRYGDNVEDNDFCRAYGGMTCLNGFCRERSAEGGACDEGDNHDCVDASCQEGICEPY